MTFTKRETEVMIKTASGHSAQKVADMMGITYHTVQAHLRHIKEKFWSTKNFITKDGYRPKLSILIVHYVLHNGLIKNIFDRTK